MHIAAKGRERAAISSMENELLREASDDLDRDASVPQKREQFHNKTNCATIWFPLQRSNQDDLCDPVFTKAICISSTHVFNSTCCRLTPNKYTTCQEDEVGFDMSIPNSFRTLTTAGITKIFSLIIEESHEGGNSAQQSPELCVLTCHPLSPCPQSLPAILTFISSCWVLITSSSR